LPWENLYEGQTITREIWEKLYGCLCKLKDYEEGNICYLGSPCPYQNDDIRVNENNGWIPCSETPQTTDYILLSFSNFSLPLVGRYEEDENGGAYYIGDEDETCVSQGIFVNAWQPLPPAYKEEV
ncbi:MAG: hypothetical protein ACOCM4_15075, partial [Acetivibrio ethanolgignens]